MAWQRARRHGHCYFDPKEQTSYKSLVAYSAREALKKGFSLIQDAIRLEVSFYFKRPKNRCRAVDSKDAITMSKRPDLDNCLKMIGDALNGIVWHDDGLISESIVRKLYHEIGGAPRTEIRIFFAKNV